MRTLLSKDWIGRRAWTSSMSFRYTLLYILVILILSIVLLSILLQFTADRLQRYELSAAENAMQLAADDMESQYTMIRDVAYRISVNICYQPYVLKTNRYRDIELLEDFILYKNYSPLLEHYFMLYLDAQLQEQRIFTSDGSISYFRFYSQAKWGIMENESNMLYQRICDTIQADTITIGDDWLLVFPIRFFSSGYADGSAVMVCILKTKDVIARMNHVAVRLPECIAVQMNNAIFGAEETLGSTINHAGIAQNPDGSHNICVISKNGGVRVAGIVHLDKWELLLSSVSIQLLAAIAVSLLAVSVMALRMGKATVRPLRNIIQRHMPKESRANNELTQIETIISRIEQENNSSLKELRNRLLLSILRGDSSETLLEHCVSLRVSFHHCLYNIEVIDVANMQRDEIGALTTEIETFTNPSETLYAVYVSDDEVLAVIVGFDQLQNGAAVHQRLYEAALRCGTQLSAGKNVSADLERLPISYMEAMTAHLRTQKWKNGSVSDVYTFFAQLVAATETNDDEKLQQLSKQWIERLERDNAPGIVYGNLRMQLLTELSIAARERQVSLDYERLSVLRLVPSYELFMTELCALVRDTFRKTDEEPDTNRTERVSKAIAEYVRENAFDMDFELNRIAEKFGLSSDYVSAMIKRVTGFAFKDYLTQLRLQRACVLLCEQDDRTVGDISTDVGYRKASNFIRKFREKYNCTPLQYREIRRIQ